ncbi:hypothetical protein PRZ48_004985 [Zasmidium cellare]|uniref:Uncharacterized protein n=1 Tax=Zasmidium cellare TaxID=395010 RepID=A0ABR0ES42_ZASCE|nr:hypothetical protein PRZ48_004985 [Zasmidium cellare]
MNTPTRTPPTNEQACQKDEEADIGLVHIDLVQRIEHLHGLIIRLYRDRTLPIKHHLKAVLGGLSDKASMIPGYEGPDKAISLGKAVLNTLGRHIDSGQVVMENQEAMLEELRTAELPADVIRECEGTQGEMREHVNVVQREAEVVAAAIGEVEKIWEKASTKEKEEYLEAMSRRTGKRKRGWRCGLM